MPQTNSFRAWIRVDGRDTWEFKREVSPDGTTVTCWIASQLGKNFSVHWRRNKTYRSHSVGYVKVDGKPCAGRVIYAHASDAQVGGVTEGSMIKPFTFSSLETTDDDSFLENPAHPDLGVISLTITPVVVGQRGKLHEGADSEYIPQSKVHERMNKAVTQQVGLGNARSISYTNTVASIALAGEAVVTILWRYRPIEFLRAIEVAPQLKRTAQDASLNVQTSKKSKRNKKETVDPPTVAAASTTGNSRTSVKIRTDSDSENAADLLKNVRAGQKLKLKEEDINPLALTTSSLRSGPVKIESDDAVPTDLASTLHTPKKLILKEEAVPLTLNRSKASLIKSENDETLFQIARSGGHWSKSLPKKEEEDIPRALFTIGIQAGSTNEPARVKNEQDDEKRFDLTGNVQLLHEFEAKVCHFLPRSRTFCGCAQADLSSNQA
ncbi:hypothetical protein C8F01DRAFT_1181612 [Mycena amicta]|nr:hypothetical protein C8F01DRAFT_1181612 [Mycena amicta]